jgi:hypothetical protein
LAFQTATLASKLALVSAKNIFTSSAIVWWSRSDTYFASSTQCPGGDSVDGPSDQYSAIAFSRSRKPALYCRTCSACSQ